MAATGSIEQTQDHSWVGQSLALSLEDAKDCSSYATRQQPHH